MDDGPLSRWLTAWVGAVRRRARGVAVATAIVSVALLAYTVTHLGINTSHKALLGPNLPFWKAYNEFAEVFPVLDDAVLVVVDAESPSQARTATDSLAARLAARKALFEDVYVPGGGTFFERHALLYLSVEDLEDLSDHLASLQPLLAQLAADQSLPSLANMLEEGIELARSDSSFSVDLSAVFDSVSRAAQAVLEGRPRPVSWTEVLLQRSLPGDSARRIIVLQPNLDYQTLLPARPAIRAIREDAAALSLDEDHGVRVRITGNAVLNHEEMIAVARQVTVAAAVSFLLVGFILVGALGSGRLVSEVLATLLVGLVATAAFAAFAVGHLNVISVAFAVLFIGLGVDFGIHLAMHYAELEREGEPHAEALAHTARIVGRSLVVCAVTTAIGFYVFVPTEYRGVAELGLVSGTGMIVSLFCSLTVLPALLSLGDTTRVGRGRTAPSWFTDSLVPLAVRHSHWVLGIGLALGAASLVLVPRAHFDHNVARMRDPNTESVQAFDDLLAESDTSPWTIDVMAPDAAAAEALAARLRALPVVERAVTLADYVPEQQEEKLEILADMAYFVPPPPPPDAPRSTPGLAVQIAALRTLRESLNALWLSDDDPARAGSARRAAVQLDRFLDRLRQLEQKEDVEALADFETSLIGALPDQLRVLWRSVDPGPVTLENLPEDLRRRMLAPDGRARIEVLPREDLSDNRAKARFVDAVKAVAPSATGSAVSLLEWARATVHAFQQALASAAVAIALVVWLVWRRLSDVALVLAPLALAALLTVATAALLEIHFNFANVIVLPLLLGIGVDSGIHLVSRHRELVESQGAAGGREMLGTSTAQAVFFSALTTMASFGSLAFASHRGIASLGRLLLIGVVYTLICNLVALPALVTRVRGPSDEGRSR